MYEKILVAADGSDHSKRAAHEAVKMAKANPQAFITLLYVIDYEKARTEILHGQSSDEVTWNAESTYCRSKKSSVLLALISKPKRCTAFRARPSSSMPMKPAMMSC